MQKNNNIPDLRFPGFYNEWNKSQLKSIGKFIGGGTPSKNIDEYWNGNIPWISSSDISEDKFYVNVRRFITKEAINKSATKIVTKGSLLIVSRVGVGKIGIADSDICTSQDFINMEPNSDVNNIFLAYLLKHKTKTLLGFNQGTSIKGFTKNDLANLTIDFPGILEQQKIATFLSSIDEWIGTLKSQKEALERYKKGILQKILAQKIRFKDVNGNYFPDWNEYNLGDFLILELREVFKPNSTYKSIGIRSHFKGTFQRFDTDPSKISMDKLYKVKENDLIVNITFAWEGAVAIAKKEDEDGLVSHRFPTYTFDITKTYPDFFKYIFTSKRFKNILVNISPGGAGRNRVLSKKDFLKITVKLPSIKEQQKITKFINAIDNLIYSKEEKINKVEIWKKGMMQKLYI